MIRSPPPVATPERGGHRSRRRATSDLATEAAGARRRADHRSRRGSTAIVTLPRVTDEITATEPHPAEWGEPQIRTVTRSDPAGVARAALSRLAGRDGQNA